MNPAPRVVRVFALLATSATLSMLGGCAKDIRMSASFDDVAAGSAPPSSPTPSPPNDSYLWAATFVTSTVTSRPGGGNWVRTVPKPKFMTDPDMRRLAAFAYTDALTLSPPTGIRGSVTIDMEGRGRVFVGLQNVVGNAPGSYLGGALIDIPPLAPGGGSVLAIAPFANARITDVFPLPGAGPIQPYAASSIITIRWNIDQATRTLSVSTDTSGATSHSVQYPAVADGIANTPLNRVLVSVWLQQVGPSTAVMLDDFHAEEFK
jgi:hypothetical protein